MYSNPPIHGAKIIDEILTDVRLLKMWHGELKQMAGRISDMRKSLVRKLGEEGSPHDWSHLTRQIGMFGFTGLTKEQVNRLKEEYHIYMTLDGRISIAGINTANVDTIAKAFHQVTKDSKL
jgi:aspartate aminotransferase